MDKIKRLEKWEKSRACDLARWIRNKPNNKLASAWTNNLERLVGYEFTVVLITSKYSPEEEFKTLIK